MATPSLAQQHVTAIVSVIAAAPYALFLRELFLTRSHTAYSQTFSHDLTRFHTFSLHPSFVANVQPAAKRWQLKTRNLTHHLAFKCVQLPAKHVLVRLFHDILDYKQQFPSVNLHIRSHEPTYKPSN